MVLLRHSLWLRMCTPDAPWESVWRAHTEWKTGGCVDWIFRMLYRYYTISSALIVYIWNRLRLHTNRQGRGALYLESLQEGMTSGANTVRRCIISCGCAQRMWCSRTRREGDYVWKIPYLRDKPAKSNFRIGWNFLYCFVGVRKVRLSTVLEWPSLLVPKGCSSRSKTNKSWPENSCFYKLELQGQIAQCSTQCLCELYTT